MITMRTVLCADTKIVPALVAQPLTKSTVKLAKPIFAIEGARLGE